jgi:uncharacterized protein YgbK (DUF1537 family)
MVDNRVLVLADDLTGALEVGAKFALAGVSALVTTELSAPPLGLEDSTVVLVVDTDSRHVSASEADRRVRGLARGAHDATFRYLYKKTDSTLRGNIGSELAAVLEEWPDSALLYVPAYPQMGITARRGSLYLDGIPVSNTTFGTDLLNPVRGSHIASLLGRNCHLPIMSIKASTIGGETRPGLYICDCETDTDIEEAARAFMGSSTFCLAAGPCCFASHLAWLIQLPRRKVQPLPALGSALIVNGSLHEVSVRQVRNARQNGFGLMHKESIRVSVDHSRWIILDTQSRPGESPLDFAKQVGQIVCQILTRVSFDALIIFGGDTAHAIVEAIGNPPIYPVNEVLEGIPVSKVKTARLSLHSGDRGRDLHLITKAGGFGPVDVLRTIQKVIGER